MVEPLEHLIRRAAQKPNISRAPLYRELLRSETFLLTLDKPIAEETLTRTARPDETFPVWVDRDAEIGGSWVPVFPSREAVALYVRQRNLNAPRGKEFLWMSHKPGVIFSLARGIRYFAGLRLILDESSCVPVDWPEVQALAAGKLPPDSPETYELPVARLALPADAPLTFGRIQAGRLLCLPRAGSFRAEDLRKLVKLPLELGQTAWMPCRHFLQVLRFVYGHNLAADRAYAQDFICSLISFQMYGEAEDFCEWLSRRGPRAYAWLALSAVYGRMGRWEECAQVCRRGAEAYPQEKSFAINGARAFRRLGREEAAREILAAALARFPEDERLAGAFRETNG